MLLGECGASQKIGQNKAPPASSEEAAPPSGLRHTQQPALALGAKLQNRWDFEPLGNLRAKFDPSSSLTDVEPKAQRTVDLSMDPLRV